MTLTPDLQTYRRTERLMGNQFVLSVVAPDAARADRCLDAAIGEIRRIETLLTTFSETSDAARINAAAGLRPVPVAPEVYALIERSIGISRLTQGAFDISYGALDKRLWNFDRALDALPDRATARRLVRLIDYRKVRLDPAAGTVFLEEAGMRIGFGGIGKGYAAERAKSLLQDLGVASGVVNASGDLCAWGCQPDGRPWTVGIASPGDRSRPLVQLPLRDAAIATSGDYEKFVIIGGRRYSHTIDPRTGYPVAGIKSVSVVCANAELADALATPVLVMGVRAGLDLINQMRGVACLLIDEHDRVFTSANFKIS
ncbi:MAG: FAD:protein FMN transferase [Chitinophagaceae bacterium]|nr:MAG: FAD:protein FMN transferase [Chitinophagaceae bacterium]